MYVNLVESVGLDFIETSAKSGLNVDTAFRRAVISVARLLPHIKDSLKGAHLPAGWVQLHSTDAKKKTEYQVRRVVLVSALFILQ